MVMLKTVRDPPRYKRRRLVYTIAPFYEYSPGKLDKDIDITSESETGPVVLNIGLLVSHRLTSIYPFFLLFIMQIRCLNFSIFLN